jgi:hypothetical protein
MKKLRETEDELVQLEHSMQLHMERLEHQFTRIRGPQA